MSMIKQKPEKVQTAQFPERVGIKRPDHVAHQKQLKALANASTRVHQSPISVNQTLKPAPAYTQSSTTDLPTSGALYQGVLRRRLIAFLIDMIIIAFIVLIVKEITKSLLLTKAMRSMSWGVMLYASLGMLVTIIYNTVLIASKKQATFGMSTAGLKVTTPQGGRPQFKHDLLHVGLFYLLYFLVFPVALDFMSAIFRKDRRTFRDRLTGYVLVRAKVFDKM